MNKSENENVKEKKPKNGLGFRITQAIIYTLAFVGSFTGMLISSLQWSQNLILESYNIILLSQWLVVVIISWLVAFLGKKYRWANIICIIINTLALIGLFGLIGGIKGLKAIPKKEKEKTAVQPSGVTPQGEAVSILGADETESQAQPQVQGVQASVKQPNKKVGWALFGTMTAYYLFLLVFGILSMLMPEKGLAWGPYDNLEYTIAMNVITGFILILLVPSFGYFLACRAPFRMGKKGSIIIFVASLALTIVGDVLFYILMRNYLSLVSFTMKLSPILAEVGLIAIYLVGFLKLSPDKLTKTQYEKTGNTWKDLFGGLINTLSNGLKFLMLRRNSTGFVIGGTVLFSLCLFVMMELLYAVLAVAIILLLAVLVSSLYVRSNVYSNEYLVTDESGTTRTLNYQSYNNFTGENIYKDESGGVWATKDGGKSFYPITADNARQEERSEEGRFKNY